MTQAVKNERLAVKEKLLSFYENRIKESVKQRLSPDWISLNMSLTASDGFLVYDSKNKLTYPVDDINQDVTYGDTFRYAFELEYADNALAKAIVEYQQIAAAADKDTVRIIADIAQVRCLRKLKRIDEAIAKLRTTISKYADDDKFLRVQKCRAHVLLLELYRQTNGGDFKKALIETFDYAVRGMATDDELVFLGRNSHTNKYIPSSLQLFALNRFIDYAGDMQDEPSINGKYKRAKYLVERVSTSLMLRQKFPLPVFADPVKFSSGIFRLDTEEQLYCRYKHIDDYLYMMVYTPHTIAAWFDNYIKDMLDLPSLCSIYDEKGQFVAGSRVAGRKPFVETQLNIGGFNGWTTALYIDDSAFENAASKQSAIYIWTAILVVLFILTSGAVATQAIGRQIKLNRIKNDFIATVTHELKTPLSSMRVLVDTLLEGNYNDKQQATEYLHLISKENTRLTHLIDNFLTFSRMERNKQAFDMLTTSPGEIATAACDAVRTKFDNDKCDFELTIDENLPDITADKDAMTTVIINLLDNAYKYSYDDKRIRLKVFAENNFVCFKVSDNGTGMSRRQTKRVFDRFYQADSSLSRQAEGTGLGLSIVKFIVDAHKGHIDVETKPGKGSEFTVKLPI
jgi:signal transduction histidine kinase